MDINNLGVLTHLTHRWGTIQAWVEQSVTDPVAQEVLHRLIVTFKLIEQSGMEAGKQECSALADWLWQNEYSLGVVLEMMFQIKKISRPILLREYPGVEGYWQGELQFQELGNILLTQIGDAYSACARAALK